MNILEYCDILNVELDIKYYPNQGYRFTAQLYGAEVKDGSVLSSVYGTGTSPTCAIEHYILAIRGKRLVFNAADPSKRREYDVPKYLIGLGKE